MMVTVQPLKSVKGSAKKAMNEGSGTTKRLLLEDGHVTVSVTGSLVTPKLVKGPGQRHEGAAVASTELLVAGAAHLPAHRASSRGAARRVSSVRAAAAMGSVLVCGGGGGESGLRAVACVRGRQARSRGNSQRHGPPGGV